MDDEAELGSDIEEHDDVRKKIKHSDDEEDESGLDSDVSKLVNDEALGDEEEIAEANAALREKFY